MDEVHNDAFVFGAWVDERPVLLKHLHDLDPVVSALNFYRSVHTFFVGAN